MTSREHQFWRFDNPIVGGIYATLAVAIFGAWLANRKDCVDAVCVDKYAQFLALPANGIGDALAGFAGALAFVWLIATVWLQGQELAEQRRELARMADAQAEQVRALKLQGEIFQEEQMQRRQARAKEVLDAYMSELVFLINEYGDKDVFEVVSPSLATSGKQLLSSPACSYLGPVQNAPKDNLCRSLPDLLNRKIQMLEKEEIKVKQGYEIDYQDLEKSLDQILDAIQKIKPRLAEDQALRVTSVRIDQSRSNLSHLHCLIERLQR